MGVSLSLSFCVRACVRVHVCLSVCLSVCVCVCEPGNNISDAGAAAIAPALKGLTSLTVLALGSEWVIGCV